MEMAHLFKIAFHAPEKLTAIDHQIRTKHSLVPKAEDVKADALKLLNDSQTQPVVSTA